MGDPRRGRDGGTEDWRETGSNHRAAAARAFPQPQPSPPWVKNPDLVTTLCPHHLLAGPGVD